MYTYVNILHSVNKELNWIEYVWTEALSGKAVFAQAQKLSISLQREFFMIN